MDLPASVAAVGEQMRASGEAAPTPELFHASDVFAAERDRIFMRPWMAVDHQERLDENGRYFRFDAATRSILVTRTAEGSLHALRNLCIHAGYPVCEAEEGPAKRLICPYHGWEYTLDGQLVEPQLSGRIDPARLRLTSYPVSIRDGLIFVDLSGASGLSQQSGQSDEAAQVPDWLAEGAVTQRTRYSTKWNWKLTLQFLKASPDLCFDNCNDGGGSVTFGPLSWLIVQPQQAALLRVVPKSAEHTDVQLIRIEPRGAPPQTGALTGADRLAEGLQQAGDADAVAPLCDLGPQFFGWYWSLMSPGMSPG
jgi:nitrite reductase/ring-hydroxylating ferredoxin subunit